MRKTGLAVSLAAALLTAGALTAFAGQWGQENGRWYWQNDDGSRIVNSWAWLDGNRDGVAESYHFDAQGYMDADTTVDGYQVNADGAWVENGTVQTKAAGTGTQNGSTAAAGAGYYSGRIQLEIRNGRIYWNKENTFWSAGLDGSDKRQLLDHVAYAVFGPDGKIYYGSGGRLMRCNADGSGKETVYIQPQIRRENKWFPDESDYYIPDVRVEFADSDGIQTERGFYDIRTGIYSDEEKREKRRIDSSDFLEARYPGYDEFQYIDENSSVYRQCRSRVYLSNDCIFTLRENKYAPDYLIGEVWFDPHIAALPGHDIVEIDVFRKDTGERVGFINPKNQVFAFIQSPAGLFIYGSASLYRLEDGGKVTNPAPDYPFGGFIFDGDTIYYIGYRSQEVRTIQPAALPMSPAQGSSNMPELKTGAQ